jgi:hypothetical protein
MTWRGRLGTATQRVYAEPGLSGSLHLRPLLARAQAGVSGPGAVGKHVYVHGCVTDLQGR